MNILYIWNGENPLLGRQKYIEQTYKLYPDAKYYCVSKNNPLPFAETLDWDIEKEKMREFFKLPTCPKSWENNIVFSDWYRFYFLINNPNTLFLDTDCMITKYFDFEKEDKIIQPENEIFFLYSPLNNEFTKVKKVLDRHIKLNAVGILIALGSYIKRQTSSKVLSKEYYKHK